MLEYVKNNPYRILGVYANDPEKKWVENSLELFVSLKHDNTFAFPTDWSEALGPMYRTLKNVKDAAFILEDNDSRTLEALFWVHWCPLRQLPPRQPRHQGHDPRNPAIPREVKNIRE